VVRVCRAGVKGFVVQYRAGRRPRRMSLGPSTVFDCDSGAHPGDHDPSPPVKNGEDLQLSCRPSATPLQVSDLAERFDKETHRGAPESQHCERISRQPEALSFLPPLGRMCRCQKINPRGRGEVTTISGHIPYQANRRLRKS